jgi:hypothetical protein
MYITKKAVDITRHMHSAHTYLIYTNTISHAGLSVKTILSTLYTYTSHATILYHLRESMFSEALLLLPLHPKNIIPFVIFCNHGHIVNIYPSE